MVDIGVAVVGTGFIGPVHVEALRRLGVRVMGILGSSPVKSETARDALGLPKAYSSFSDVLDDQEVQAVHLAVPNVLHFPMVKEAIAAGKHVMCEKPLAMTASETAELTALAEKKDLALGVCYNIRFYPLNLEARQRVMNGDLGEIYAINGSYLQDWLLYDNDYNWRVLAEQGGELRAVADIGTHWIDLVTSITGLEVESVFADLNTIHKVRRRPTGEVETFTGKTKKLEQTESVNITTDDYGCVLFRFKNGARGTLIVSQITAGRKNCLRYEISGSSCSVHWNSEEPNALNIGHRDIPNERLIRDPALLGDMAGGYTTYPGGHNEGFSDTFKQCFKAFYSHIAEGDFSAKPMFPTFEDGHREVVLCEAILRSHREERWITLEA